MRTTSTPGPSSTTTILDREVPPPSTWWDWFVGLPLRIILIVAISSIVLFLLRRSIRTITNHVAEGTPFLDRGILRPIGESEVGSVLAKANPLSSARRAQRARTIGSVLRSTSTIVVGGIAFFLILAELGVNLAPFIASAGVIGVALGFGAQSLVKDFLTGLFMLLEDQYGVGDVVDVGPANGTVEAVTLRITKIRDSDGTLWYVPNGTMLRVGNKTQGWATAVVEIDVDYFADLDQVRGLLAQAASRVVKDPVVGAHVLGEPTITGIERLSADAVTLRLKVKTSPAMQWEVARELRTATREVLERADVPLAGQRDLMATHRAALAPQDDEPEPTPRDPRSTPLDDVVSNRDARVSASRDEPVPTEEPPPPVER
ncbi:mechanosensitive ion channel family protein [Cellulomonas xylanilytica]|uniref:Mechanosensitive ion channel protein MscS n=1 Tax=Cellulomonas xylanilytica TaxID=233583 RepID=A0A510V1T9_9CELL|nr:mechanosensitive ion channel family protein [Cellulomonas xylanilytica]GEK20863.1 mechanosensitive ion channel protein MscS [Cellulomonas xylanilytica]